MKKYHLYCLFMLCGLSTAVANDDFVDWQKSYTHEFRDADQRGFTEYLSRQDQQFADHLKRQWQAFRAFSGMVRDETPKPIEPPRAEPFVPAEISLPDQPPEPFPPISEPVPPLLQQGNVEFLGQRLALSFPEGVASLTFSTETVDNQQIAQSWQALSRLSNAPLLGEFAQYKGQLQLNDWGYLQLLIAAADTAVAEDSQRQTLLVWFWMVKSGFDVRLGHDGSVLLLLLPAQQNIYANPYLELAGRHYYIVNLSGRSLSGRFFTYQESYPEAEGILDLRLQQLPKPGTERYTRQISFDYGDRPITFNLPLSRTAIEFLQTYPQTDLDVYFAATLDPLTAHSLLATLRPYLAEMDQREGVNFLLQFVQHGFAYQTDGEQFGAENYLFPEETLYYRASDCEDRSVLFAWLVRELLGLRVIGLSYPGHVATAVALPGNVPGDSVVYHGERYAVADPTYINARVGMAMPQYRLARPEVIGVTNQ